MGMQIGSADVAFIMSVAAPCTFELLSEQDHLGTR